MYIANLVALMTRYPLAFGERAIDAVRRSTKFLPTEAELYDALEHEYPSYAPALALEAALQLAERVAYEAKAPSAEDKARVADIHTQFRRRPIAPDPLDRRDDF